MPPQAQSTPTTVVHRPPIAYPATRRGHAPIALVAGFLGPSLAPPSNKLQDSAMGQEDQGKMYWGEAMKFHNPTDHPVIVLSPSGVASLHDRAIELFYELKGGRVDYGEAHSLECGHDRFGRTFTSGKFPQWNQDNPIHLVGHSFGGMTIRALQHLLARGDMFPGFDTNANWVRSITAISSPLNGSLGVYALGAGEVNPSDVVTLSVGDCIGKAAFLYEFLDVRWLKTHVFDFGLSHWQLSFRDFGRLGLTRLAQAFFGTSVLFESADHAAYDMTIHSAAEWNRKIETNPSTYYLSVVASKATTSKPHVHRCTSSVWRCLVDKNRKSGCDVCDVVQQSDHHLLVCSWLWFALVTIGTMMGDWFSRTMRWFNFLVMGLWIKAKSFADLQPTSCFQLDLWDHHNGDGLLCTFTQSHPRVPATHEATTHVLENEQLVPEIGEAVPGKWYVSHINVDHLGIIPFPPNKASQNLFFKSLFSHLWATDSDKVDV